MIGENLHFCGPETQRFERIDERADSSLASPAPFHRLIGRLVSGAAYQSLERSRSHCFPSDPIFFSFDLASYLFSIRCSTIFYILSLSPLHFITRQNVRKIDLPLLISNFKCNAERAFLLFLFLVKQRRQLSILRINPSCQTGPDRRILLSLYSTREIFALSVTNDENVSLLRISPDRIDFAVSRPKDRHKGVNETGRDGKRKVGRWRATLNRTRTISRLSRGALVAMKLGEALR